MGTVLLMLMVMAEGKIRRIKTKIRIIQNLTRIDSTIAFKYSNRSKSSLHEAVILDGRPVFLTYDRKNDKIKTVESIQESNRVINPPKPEEYPYEAYEFASIDEVLSYAESSQTRIFRLTL